MLNLNDQFPISDQNQNRPKINPLFQDYKFVF